MSNSEEPIISHCFDYERLRERGRERRRREGGGGERGEGEGGTVYRNSKLSLPLQSFS